MADETEPPNGAARERAFIGVDPLVTAAAGALMRQYGRDAAVIATMRAAEEAARGDLAASDFWMAVAGALET